MEINKCLEILEENDLEVAHVLLSNIGILRINEGKYEEALDKTYKG